MKVTVLSQHPYSCLYYTDLMLIGLESPRKFSATEQSIVVTIFEKIRSVLKHPDNGGN